MADYQTVAYHGGGPAVIVPAVRAISLSALAQNFLTAALYCWISRYRASTVRSPCAIPLRFSTNSLSRIHRRWRLTAVLVTDENTSSIPQALKHRTIERQCGAFIHDKISSGSRTTTGSSRHRAASARLYAVSLSARRSHCVSARSSILAREWSSRIASGMAEARGDRPTIHWHVSSFSAYRYRSKWPDSSTTSARPIARTI